jgi:hypothetical protein
MSVSFLSTTSVRNIFRSDKYLTSYPRHARRNAHVGVRVKCPLMLSGFKQNANVSTKTSLYRISLKYILICYYVRTDRQTYMTNLIRGVFAVFWLGTRRKQKLLTQKLHGRVLYYFDVPKFHELLGE